MNAEYPASGKVTQQRHEKPKIKMETPTAQPNRRSTDEFFKNRDRNGDGGITLEEFIGNPKGRNVPALTKRFKQLDSNDDGRLELNELEAKKK